MPIAVQCGSCDTRFRVPDSAAGSSVKCPKCPKRFIAPDATDTSGAPNNDQPPRRRPTSSSSAKRPVLAEAADDAEEGSRDSSTRPTAPKAKAIGLLVGIGASAALLLLGALWGAGAFSSPKAKHVDPPEVRISGDLFLVTKTKESRKLGGQTLYLVPRTPELERSLQGSLGKLKAINAERAAFQRRLDMKYGPADSAPKSQEMERNRKDYSAKWVPVSEAVEATLAKGRQRIVTNADGKFEAQVPPGKYVLYTESIWVEDMTFAWVEAIDAKKDVTLVLKREGFDSLQEPWASNLLLQLESRLGLSASTP